MNLYGFSYITGFSELTALPVVDVRLKPEVHIFASAAMDSIEIVEAKRIKLSGSATVNLDNKLIGWLPKGTQLEVGSADRSGPTFIFDVYPCNFSYPDGPDRPVDNGDCLIPPYITALLSWDPVLTRWFLTISSFETVSFKNGMSVRGYSFRFFSKNDRQIHVSALGQPVYSYNEDTDLELGCSGYYKVYCKGKEVPESFPGAHDFQVYDYPVMCDGMRPYNFDICGFELPQQPFESPCYTREDLVRINSDGEPTSPAVQFTANPVPAGYICVNGQLYLEYTHTEPASPQNSSLRLGEFPVVGAPMGASATPVTIHLTSPKIYIDGNLDVFMRAFVPDTSLFRMFKIFNFFDVVDLDLATIYETFSNTHYQALLRSYIFIVILEIPYKYILPDGRLDTNFIFSADNTNDFVVTDTGLLGIDTNYFARQLPDMEFIRWNWNIIPISQRSPYQWMHVDIHRSKVINSTVIEPDECPSYDTDLDALEVRINTVAHAYITMPLAIGVLDIATGFYAYVNDIRYLASKESVAYGTLFGALPNGSDI